MAERLAAAPAGTVAAERDVLLATKLHMPVPRPGLVLRSRLAGQLDHARARGVILAWRQPDTARRSWWPTGPAHRGPGRVAVAGRRDNDPARLWLHVVAALDRAVPGIADRVAPLLVPLLGPLAPGPSRDWSPR